MFQLEKTYTNEPKKEFKIFHAINPFYQFGCMI